MDTKTCSKCDKTLSLTDFHKNGSNGYMPQCKICRSKERKAQTYDRKEGSKLCPNCEKERDSSKFDSDKRNQDGLQTYCKKCRDKQRKARLNTISN